MTCPVSKGINLFWIRNENQFYSVQWQPRIASMGNVGREGYSLLSEIVHIFSA